MRTRVQKNSGHKAKKRILDRLDSTVRKVAQNGREEIVERIVEISDNFDEIDKILESDVNLKNIKEYFGEDVARAVKTSLDNFSREFEEAVESLTDVGRSLEEEAEL